MDSTPDRDGGSTAPPHPHRAAQVPSLTPTASVPSAASGHPGPQRTLSQVIDEWNPRLAKVLADWHATLPPEAAETWTRGAAYIRESSGTSLAGDAADVQLRQVLAMLARRCIYVAPEALFFDVQSGTDIAPRAAFRRLFEQAVGGGFKAIGVFVNERLFRNLAQSIEIKREFRLKGIELVYMGRYEGDRRNPAAWHFETTQDTAAELHARNTGYYIGTHFEVISRQGRPVGSVPEVYAPGPRAESFLGRRGSILSWSLTEPLASILKAGLRRYLDGDSFADLAVWSTTTALQGQTPKGRIMDKAWWANTLKNPRLAGYQMPTTYTGFKPGKESPPRPKLTAKSELVPCVLPALWTLEDYRAVQRIAQERSHAPKRRRRYRSYLLAGIAYDGECGHKLRVQQMHPRSQHYWMACDAHGAGPRHSPGRRADIAGQELDEIIASLSFEDEALHRAVEEELRRMSEAQHEAVERFRPNPEIAAARQALAALGHTAMQDLRTSLEERIADLEAEDRKRRDAGAQPVIDYRRALEHLRGWDAVWKDADVDTKNRLVRDAELRVVIGPLPDDKKGRPCHILGLQAGNPVFSLALAAALKERLMTSGQEHSCSRPNVISEREAASGITLALPRELLSIAERRLITGNGGGGAVLLRPAVDIPRSPHRMPPDRPAGQWLTVAEYADRTGRSRSTIYGRIRKGQLETVLAYRGGIRWHLIRVDGSDLALAA